MEKKTKLEESKTRMILLHLEPQLYKNLTKFRVIWNWSHDKAAVIKISFLLQQIIACMFLLCMNIVQNQEYK